MAAVVAKREGPQFISEAAVRGNAAILDYCRTSVSALSGATAGILGLNGLYGFIFYFLASVLLSEEEEEEEGLVARTSSEERQARSSQMP
ncbi:hypothetical protein E2320_018071 [Naja naja]|nr:hypothetical protein E2320_018071 [Naja naja]